MDNLGGSQRSFETDSQEFDQIKRYVQSLPAPPAKGQLASLQGERAAVRQAEPDCSLRIAS